MAPAVAPPADDIRKKVWTREELYALLDLGLLAGQRWELIEGEVYDKRGQQPPHAAAIARLTDILVGLCGGGRVSIQLPVQVAPAEEQYSDPEPDVAVLHGARSADHHPGPTEVLFLIEVADTTLRFDLGRKANLYARAGYREYLVLNLPQQQLHVMRRPVEGAYTDVTILRPGDTFEPAGAPDISLAVGSLFDIA